jgi:hypothetical protein
MFIIVFTKHTIIPYAESVQSSPHLQTIFHNTVLILILSFQLSVGWPEGRRQLGRPRRKWEDNIKMYLGEIGFGDVDWIHLAQDRDRWRALVNTVMNLRVP